MKLSRPCRERRSRGSTGVRAPAAAPSAAAPGAVAPVDTVVRRHWRLPADTRSIPALRRRLWALFAEAGLDEDLAYDLVLAACEAATNAIEHAQEPAEPVIEESVSGESVAEELVAVPT